MDAYRGMEDARLLWPPLRGGGFLRPGRAITIARPLPCAAPRDEGRSIAEDGVNVMDEMTGWAGLILLLTWALVACLRPGAWRR